MRPVAFIFLTSLSAGPLHAADVDYTHEIKPLIQAACVKCHGVRTQKNALRLDTAAAAIKGGKNGAAIVPGKSTGSLFIQTVEGTHGDIAKMPYKRPPLDSGQIALLRKWIDEGAKAPADEKPSDDRHWAFVAPVRPAVPRMSDLGLRIAGWAGSPNPIDAFIAQRLAKEGLQPSPTAAPETLIRRLYLDLLGLPPTPAEVQAFVGQTRDIGRDASRDGARAKEGSGQLPAVANSSAYARLVDHVLESPHYGERWARWWLDQARYADSNGYSIDAPRTIWPWRDWVVGALNANMRFDEFTVEQLAGDLLPGATTEQKIATGFHRNTQVNGEGGIDPEQFRVESVVDRVNTTGTVWLGMSVGCAQCHDHKFDPLTQKEYYEIFAFFNGTEQDGHGGTKTSTVALPPTKDEGALQLDINNLRFDLDRFFRDNNPKVVEASAAEAKLTPEQKKKLPPDTQKALATPYLERTLDQQRLVFELVMAKDAGFKKLNDPLREREKGIGPKISTLVMQEIEKPRETRIYIKGDFTRPDAVVKRAVPAFLNPLPSRPTGSPAQSGPTRLDLARWLVDKSNPLTARVIMNRVWQQYFGRGLVETENDFGTMGSPPTHPGLLDWLAVEFMESGWDLKHMHRLIVTSEVYRQASVQSSVSSVQSKGNARAAAAAEHSTPNAWLSIRRGEDVDPKNYLLWRQTRLRLDAEVVRDVMLSASGLLCDKLGGPPVYPPIPDGVMSLGQVKRAWPLSKGEDRYRRGLYTFVFRATPPPSLSVFDAPEGFSACTRRIRSNTPLQALTMLNDAACFEFAQALERIIRRDGIGAAFQRCLARKPEGDEVARLAKLDSLTAARVMLNLDETITRE
ncbi:MAG: PSD1 and planctomycete cytochrome C domain-containing protein [Verrucomicrobiaceae bacterium]|nr:PSD1 and planctomycete cytochrome C domain-containing protein [Verrucomicrobiaceae bacterium]